MTKNEIPLIVIGCSVELSLKKGIKENGVVVAMSKERCDVGIEDGGDVVVVYGIPLAFLTFVAPAVSVKVNTAKDAPPPGWAPGCGPPFKTGEVVVVMKSSPVLGGERGIVQKFDYETQSVDIRHMENHSVFEGVPSTYVSRVVTKPPPPPPTSPPPPPTPPPPISSPPPPPSNPPPSSRTMPPPPFPVPVTRTPVSPGSTLVPGDEVRLLSPKGDYVTGFVEEVRSTRTGTLVDVVEAGTGKHIPGVPLTKLQRRNKKSNQDGMQAQSEIDQLQRRSSTGSTSIGGVNDITARTTKRSSQNDRKQRSSLGPISKASVPIPNNKPSSKLKLRRSFDGREELIKVVFSEELFGFAYDDANIEDGAMEAINYGVEITSISQGSAAMLLGVKIGDIIHAIGTKVISRSAGKDSVRLLLDSLTRRPAVITFARWVNSKQDRWGEDHCVVDDISDLKGVNVHLFSRDIGLTVTNGKFRMAPGGLESQEIIVVSVKKNGSAFHQGIEKGHAILGINGMKWRTPPKAKMFYKTLEQAGRPIVIHTHRGVTGTPFTSLAPLPVQAATSSHHDGNTEYHESLENLLEDPDELPMIRESSIDPVHDLGSETPPRDRNSQSYLIGENDGKLITVSLCSKVKLGLDIGDNGYGSVTVAGVTSGSEAEVLGIRVGDNIIKVNNTVLPSSVTHANVCKLIKLSIRPLRLVLERFDDDLQSEGVFKVPTKIGEQEDLIFHNYDPIGIRCANGKNGRLFVNFVELGSYGEELLIKVGDEIVSVNGVLWTESSGDDKPAPLTRRSSSFFRSSSSTSPQVGQKKRASVIEVRKHVNRDAELLFSDVVAHSARPLLLTVRRGCAENMMSPKAKRGSMFARSASLPDQWGS